LILLALNFPCISDSKATGEDNKVVSYSENDADLLFHPSPKYPITARHKYNQGNGKYLITFNRDTGTVREVTIVTSTGSEDLDKTVTDTLRSWRAKPYTLHKVLVPVSFSLAGGREQKTLRQIEDNVIESPYPKFPFSVRWEYPSGKGVFQLQIDRRNGLVTSVKILRTMGDNRLDKAAVETLRKWRFKPQTLSELVVPIEF